MPSILFRDTHPSQKCNEWPIRQAYPTTGSHDQRVQTLDRLQSNQLDYFLRTPEAHEQNPLQHDLSLFSGPLIPLGTRAVRDGSDTNNLSIASHSA